MNDYQVIAINLKRAKEALHQEWPERLDYIIMRQFVGTEDNPPRSCTGDALVLEDVLISHGCIWEKDFYIRKTPEG